MVLEEVLVVPEEEVLAEGVLAEEVLVVVGVEEEEEEVVAEEAGVEGCRMAIVHLLLAFQFGAWQNCFVRLSGRPHVVQRKIVAGTHILPLMQEWMLPRRQHQSPPRRWHQCKQGNMRLHFSRDFFYLHIYSIRLTYYYLLI